MTKPQAKPAPEIAASIKEASKDANEELQSVNRDLVWSIQKMAGELLMASDVFTRLDMPHMAEHFRELGVFYKDYERYRNVPF
jgi:hypothetical protein